MNHLKSHNPYFNRWFSAMELIKLKDAFNSCHNPYFNRWFSAIIDNGEFDDKYSKSQSLF